MASTRSISRCLPISRIPRVYCGNNYGIRFRSSTRPTKAKKNFSKGYTESEIESFYDNTITTIDNNWISGTNLYKEYSSRDLSIKALESLNQNSLYNKNSQYKNQIDLALYHLKKKVDTRGLPLNDINDDQHKVETEIKLALQVFIEKFSSALDQSHESDRDVITLEDLLLLPIPKIPTILSSIIIEGNTNNTVKRFFEPKGLSTVEDQVNYIFEKALDNQYFQIKSNRTPVQSLKVDISNPAEWFPEARKIKRKLIMHVGPTNSGKTYNALKRLKESNNGYFAGPLRLLAREIYDRFKSEGLRCNLITGEEVLEDLDEFGNKASLSSGTVEMIDLHTYFDVAVLDEIQMIGDEYRGWAWTNALLGVKAKEVHLCGEASAVPLVKRIAELTGDDVVVQEYKRLGELKVEENPVFDRKHELKKGDCIVVFSKKKILNYKTDIEHHTKFKCGVIYGALPAETRTTEAAKFNSGEYDILIASDAIGMGLNLKINRVIFDDYKKFDGVAMCPIEAPHMKQIAGRAGRFKVAPTAKDHKSATDNLKTKDDDLQDSKNQSIGYVSAFNKKTLNHIEDAMAQPTVMLEKACLWPSDEIWSHYMSEFEPGTSFALIIQAFQKEVDQSDLYSIASIKDRVAMTTIFNIVDNLLISDQLRISTAPLSSNLPAFEEVMLDFASAIGESDSKTSLDFESLKFTKVIKSNMRSVEKYNPFHSSDEEQKEFLTNLEQLHKYQMVWLWMNNRYPTLFVDREGANDLKNLIEDKIEEILSKMHEFRGSRGFDKGKRRGKKHGKKFNSKRGKRN